MTWNEKVERIRAHFDWSRGDLARRMMVTVPCVVNWEKGRSEPVGLSRLILERLDRNVARGEVFAYSENTSDFLGQMFGESVSS